MYNQENAQSVMVTAKWSLLQQMKIKPQEPQQHESDFAKLFPVIWE